MLPQIKIPSGMVREALVVVLASKMFISQSSQASVGCTGQTSPIHVVLQLTGLKMACQDVFSTKANLQGFTGGHYFNKSELLWEPTNMMLCHIWESHDIPLGNEAPLILLLHLLLIYLVNDFSSYLSFVNSSVSVFLIFQSRVPPERGVPFPACWSGFKPSYWSQGVQLVCQPAKRGGFSSQVGPWHIFQQPVSFLL